MFSVGYVFLSHYTKLFLFEVTVFLECEGSECDYLNGSDSQARLQ